MKVCVAGAGISGVSCAYLIKKSHPSIDVTIIAKDFSPNTTSNVAAGIWEPYSVNGTPKEKIYEWAKATYDFGFDALRNNKDARDAGISSNNGQYLSCELTVDEPFWKDIVYDYHILNKKDLERFPPEIRSGYGYKTVVIEGSKMIAWLMKKFRGLGGKLKRQEIKSFADLYKEFNIIVNCAGLGNRDLLGDQEMYPARGQVLRVKAPWINEFLYDKHHGTTKFTYILPNQDFIVLGGTKTLNDWNTRPSKEDRDWILESTQRIFPSLKHAEIIGDAVGLRPMRSSVRLERENINVLHLNKTIRFIHNYGHGGSGITMFWGCSLNVLRLFNEILVEENQTSKL